MLRVIEDEKQIAKYARGFAAVFRVFADEKIRVKLGHQGASFPAKVSWSKQLGLWFFSRTVKGLRYENAFGLARPEAQNNLPIAAEINFPAAGIDRRTGGAFARDAAGNVFAVHRGMIGGGRKGIGKSLFEKHYRGVWSWMEEKGGASQVAVIGLVSSERFAGQVSLFIQKVERLKATAGTSCQTSFNFPQTGFRPELSGDAPAAPSETLAALCDRDLVLASLAAILSRGKFRIENTAGNDLRIFRPSGGGASHVFAISSDINRQSVMAQAAELMIRTTAASENPVPVPVLILPEQAALLYRQDLRCLNIRTLAYRLEAAKVIFPDLGKIRLDQSFQV